MEGPRSVLKPDGSVVPGAKSRMDEELLLEALRWMIKSRLYDQRAIVLQRQGQFGVFSPGLGQEASIVGSALALDPARDWIVPQYRELMASVHHGVPLEVMAAQSLGKIGPGRIPEGVNVLPNQVSIAAQLPQATGLAWGLRLRGKDAVVMAYIGDGGSSEGDFHEALNLAGVVKAPIVFFMQNNQWAISTSRRVQSGTKSFSLRAAGYGFEGVAVDGNDVMAVYDAACEAVERARSGGGPTLIESITYRMSFHNTTDNPSRYEDPKEHEEARTRDPIERVERYLAGLGLWDEKKAAAVTEEVREENERALQRAYAADAPRPGDVFANVYASLPARVGRQKAELLDGGA
ncbi:MAG TPA: thiamine pyrophosphate-dependent dehydrogenase E1 component subunit alpha [Candidatus Dormibacteraeota bacterium]|nr:thiamine pyrophosphate-dependent dehydrogenase E1 component subunit alpha [Candidatus Dormibacteraeota bacterium]